MEKIILVGNRAVSAFLDNDYDLINEIINEDYDGKIVYWNMETDTLTELLDQLNGWDAFIEITEHHVSRITGEI